MRMRVSCGRTSFCLTINLPRVDGFQVLAAIRRSIRCRDVPVLVMTSPAPPDKAQSATPGANGYFQKPAGFEEFLKLEIW